MMVFKKRRIEWRKVWKMQQQQETVRLKSAFCSGTSLREQGDLNYIRLGNCLFWYLEETQKWKELWVTEEMLRSHSVISSADRAVFQIFTSFTTILKSLLVYDQE